ncbi:MAG: DUF2791 family P-loop domain-containing protein [Planctomycetes bacterium]|nr:DUF2791 family P-loop domain-containing protein [Planctomycetota bacterium]
MKRGDRVVHPTWGPGEFLMLTITGKARVRFDDEPTLPRTVMRSELRAFAPQPAPSAATPTAETPLYISADVETAAEPWQVVEALRTGVVPARGVREYTVGREQSLKSLDELLAGGSGCRVVWGDYGEGKTHFLEIAEQAALDLGYATARIVLDLHEQPLHKPLRLYRALLQRLQLPGLLGRGFEPLLERLRDSREHYEGNGARASRFLSPYLHALRSEDEPALALLRDYVAGEDVPMHMVRWELDRIGWRGQSPLTMSDFRTYGRMYSLLLSTWACWARDAGMKGLVLLFDEVERVDVYDANDYLHAFEVLKHFAAITMEREDLSFDPDYLYRGGQSIHRALPLRFADDHPLTTVFALTPLGEIRYLFQGVTLSRRYDIELGPLKRKWLRALVLKVAGVYRRAYPRFELAEEALEGIVDVLPRELDASQDSFRFAVRAAVYHLDALRLAPRFPHLNQPPRSEDIAPF